MAINIFDGPEQVAEAAAELFVQRATETGESGGRLNVALSGGSTPNRLFRTLAGDPYRDRIDWRTVHFFWGDERTVPPDHADSNYRGADQALLAKVDVPAENVHRIEAELGDPEQAASRYEAELRRHFELDQGELPRFDLAFLGMGADGHTASLFPGTRALEERRRLAVAVWVEKLAANRVTLTCPVFNNAACIVFLVTGQEKAETLSEVLVEGTVGSPSYPVRMIRPVNGETLWYVDKAAGRLLGQRR
ncbi:MAG: 6-phosphogluconolactonase [Planctomycetota bacterium]|jgi:6-phosphogluconolactonase